MERSIYRSIIADLPKKIVLLSGPRQVGKTTLAKSLANNYEYLNYDTLKHRSIFKDQSWNRQTDLVILDELHKMKNWKSWLKGIYDDEGTTPPIIVTGSARLDTSKKMGDSLAGRHFSFRLHPLNLRELKGAYSREVIFKRLLEQGGFPEPFFSKEEYFYERWQRTHLDLILRQDVVDLEVVRRIQDIETLISLLRQRVGSLVSYQSLAEDLQVSPITVKRWLNLLENLFVIFRVTPWTSNVARSLQKASKYYFYDNGQIEGEIGAKFENLVANELLAYINYEQDTKGRKLELRFLRNKDGDELDFAVVEKKSLLVAIEAKWDDETPSAAFKRLLPKSLPGNFQAFQVVGKLSRNKEYPFGLRVVSAPKWLEELRF